jgi:hypothetical protein
LPSTTLPLVVPGADGDVPMLMPEARLATTMLRSAGFVPPMVLLDPSM